MVDIPKLLFQDQEWLNNEILYHFILNSFEDELQKYFEDSLDQNWTQMAVRKVISVLDPNVNLDSKPEVISYSNKKHLQGKLHKYLNCNYLITNKFLTASVKRGPFKV